MNTKNFRAELLYRGAVIAIRNPRAGHMDNFFTIKGIIKQTRTVYVTVEEGFSIVFSRAEIVRVVM